MVEGKRADSVEEAETVWRPWRERVRRALPPRKGGLAGPARTRVAMDLALVAGGVRTATLLDAWSPSAHECEALVQVLGERPTTDAMVVAVVPAHQVWVVHRPRVLRRWGDAPVVMDVSPGEPINQVALPAGAQQVLTLVHAACARSERMLVLDADTLMDARRCLVAACGWLLDYPVVYALGDPPVWFKAMAWTPSTAQHWDAQLWNEDEAPIETSLVDTSLYLVEAVLTLPTLSTPLPLVAFSIPAAYRDAPVLAETAKNTVTHHVSHALSEASPLHALWRTHTLDVRISHRDSGRIVL